MVKNANQGAGSLFTGAEFSVKFLCNLCSVCWSNHPRAFGILVEGNLLDNIGLQSLEHFCLEFWRKINCNKAKWNGSVQPVLSRTTSPARRRVGRAVPGSCAHVEASENPAVRGPRRHHCALEAVTLAWRPRPVPRSQCTLAGGRTAFPHWPSAPPHITTTPRPWWSSCRPWRWGGTASTRL
jgi:hypothetical protein